MHTHWLRNSILEIDLEKNGNDEDTWVCITSSNMGLIKEIGLSYYKGILCGLKQKYKS